MKVTKKDATITSTSPDTDFPGTFEVVLSTPALDRDGDTLNPQDWKMPLPDHITFDLDHGMSVASTVGSGKPEIDEKTGNLVVRGTFSSLPRAQEVRTLVNEGHINRTSVAFMTEKQKTKDGKTRNVRELLNGAFVAIPSNREAVILSSKGVDSAELKYAPDQERDDHGRFAGGSGGSEGRMTPSGHPELPNAVHDAAAVADKLSNGETASKDRGDTMAYAQPGGFKVQSAGSFTAGPGFSLVTSDQATAVAAYVNSDAIHEIMSQAGAETSSFRTLENVSLNEATGKLDFTIPANMFAMNPSPTQVSLPVGKSFDGATLKYSPDQDRDEAGRFAGGNLAAAGEHIGNLANHASAMRELINSSAAKGDVQASLSTGRATDHAREASFNHNTMHDNERTLSSADRSVMHLEDAAARVAELSPEHADQANAIAQAGRDSYAGYNNAMNALRADHRSFGNATLKYAPDQERDEAGRFAGGGSDGGSHTANSIGHMAIAHSDMRDAARDLQSKTQQARDWAKSRDFDKAAVANADKAVDHATSAVDQLGQASLAAGQGNHDEANSTMASALQSMYKAQDALAYSTGSSDRGRAELQAAQAAFDQHTTALSLGRKSLSGVIRTKAADDGESVSDLIATLDSTIDIAIEIFEAMDTSSLPAELQQAIGLVKSADIVLDEILSVAGIPDPDEDETTETTEAKSVPDSGANAPESGAKSAPVGDVDSLTVTAKAIDVMVTAFTTD